jgi:putative hydrolase of the HAD superfamily
MRGLLLDLDDTLIDTRTGTLRALADFHATHGHLMGIGLEEAYGRWDAGIKLHFPRYVSGEISFQEQRRRRIREVFGRPELTDGEADGFFQAYLAHYEKHWILFEDVLPFLDGIKARGIPMAIVTNGSVEQQAAKIRATGIGSRVEAAIISEAAGWRKPQPEIFLHTAERLGVAPGDCLMVGDNYQADYLGAKGAGMEAVLLDRFGGPMRTDGTACAIGLAQAMDLWNAGMR